MTADGAVHRIRAAVLRERGRPLRIESLELEGPRDEEVLVRIAAAGICHTDIAVADGRYGTTEPVVLGHEGAGVVERVGKKAKGFRRGDHVVMSYQSCGRCRECRKGRPAGCELLWEANFEALRLDGSNAMRRSRVRGHFFGQSSFATHSLATARNLVKVQRNLPLDLLAPLGCGLQTGAGTVINSLKVRKGQGVAVFGTGAVGLAAVMAAKIAGARPIVGVDIRRARLRLALELGATHVIDNRRQDAVFAISKIAGAGVDFALETTGAPGMEEVAGRALKPGGTVALIAHPNGGSLPGGRKSFGIIQGDAVPQRFIPKMIAWYRSGRFPIDRLVRYYPFKEINRAVADARRGRTIKPVLRMEDA